MNRQNDRTRTCKCINAERTMTILMVVNSAKVPPFGANLLAHVQLKCSSKENRRFSRFYPTLLPSLLQVVAP